jgi:hypothetical protein
MPSQPVTDDPGGGWSVFSPAALALYTGISLLWLGDAKQAEAHARQAITAYATQPPLLQSPANHAQARSPWRPAWSAKIIPMRASGSLRGLWWSTVDMLSRTCSRPASSSRP